MKNKLKVEISMWFHIPRGEVRTPGLAGTGDHVDLELRGEYRTCLFVLGVGPTEWDVDEVWWVDSPISALDPQGILMLEHISEDRWFIRGHGTDATSHEAYEFYAAYEDELQDEVHLYQQSKYKHDYDPEALVELYGVE
jgi:hypothetical protein